jgi:flagella basal body P-ring formation protein FlgA
MRRHILSLLLGVGALSGAASAEVSIRSDVMVDRPVVTLSDLVEGLGPAGDVPLFASPAPGESGTIRKDRVVLAAREIGLAIALPADGAAADVVTIRRAARTLGPADVEALAGEAVRDLFGLAEAPAIALRSPVALRLSSESTGAVVARVVSLDRARATATLRIGTAGAGAEASRLVEIDLPATLPVPVLRADVARHGPIGSGDIRIEERPLSAIPDGVVLDAAKLAGNSAARVLRAGDPLRASDLAPTMLVLRGEIATLVVEKNGMVLTVRGRALKAGALGDVVLVENLQSKRRVEGVVIGPGKVRVDIRATGPLAMAER